MGKNSSEASLSDVDDNQISLSRLEDQNMKIENIFIQMGLCIM